MLKSELVEAAREYAQELEAEQRCMVAGARSSPSFDLGYYGYLNSAITLLYALEAVAEQLLNAENCAKGGKHHEN